MRIKFVVERRKRKDHLKIRRERRTRESKGRKEEEKGENEAEEGRKKGG